MENCSEENAIPKSKHDVSSAAEMPGDSFAERSRTLQEIGMRLQTPEQVLAAMASEKASAIRNLKSAVDPPQTPTEKWLVELWSELLGIRQIGVREDLFQIGGHSLMAIQMLSKIRNEFGFELPIQVLFEDEVTVSKIATLIDASQIAAADGDLLAELGAEVENLSDEEVRSELLRHLR